MLLFIYFEWWNVNSVWLLHNLPHIPLCDIFFQTCQIQSSLGVLAFCHRDKTPAKNNLKGGKVILFYGLRGFSPCSLGYLALGLGLHSTWRQKVMGEEATYFMMPTNQRGRSGQGPNIPSKDKPPTGTSFQEALPPENSVSHSAPN